MSETDETGRYVCPTSCDYDCEALCHEAHDIPRKRDHDVAMCEERVFDALMAAGEPVEAVGPCGASQASLPAPICTKAPGHPDHHLAVLPNGTLAWGFPWSR